MYLGACDCAGRDGIRDSDEVMEMDDLHVYHNGFDWIIAKSLADAWAEWESLTSESKDDYLDTPFEQLDDGSELTMIDVEGVCGVFEWRAVRRLKRPQVPYFQHNGYLRVKASCADWCQAVGSGFLGSTEW
jgi:hypothetical protein